MAMRSQIYQYLATADSTTQRPLDRNRLPHDEELRRAKDKGAVCAAACINLEENRDVTTIVVVKECRDDQDHNANGPCRQHTDDGILPSLALPFLHAQIVIEPCEWVSWHR